MNKKALLDLLGEEIPDDIDLSMNYDVSLEDGGVMEIWKTLED